MGVASAWVPSAAPRSGPSTAHSKCIGNMQHDSKALVKSPIDRLQKKFAANGFAVWEGGRSVSGSWQVPVFLNKHWSVIGIGGLHE